MGKQHNSPDKANGGGDARRRGFYADVILGLIVGLGCVALLMVFASQAR